MLQAFKADGRRGLVLLGILLACILIQLASPAAFAALRYERSAIAAGEWWRLLSAHLTHLNAAHLLVNMAGVVLVWGLVVEEFSARQWLLVLLLATAAIDTGLWWLNPAIGWYVGASGLLHGLLLAGFVSGLARRDPVALIGLPILLAKLFIEQRGAALGITAGLPVVSVAHLYGVAGGAVAGAILRIRRTPPAPTAAGGHKSPARR